MIVPMKKYAFLVYHMDYTAFLHSLQDIGVVHITRKASNVDDDSLKELFSVKSSLEKTMRFLSKLKPDSSVEKTVETGLDLATKVIEKQERLEQLTQKLAALKKDKTVIEPWGDFSWENIRKLEKAGIAAGFYVCAAKRFGNIAQKVDYIEKIGERNGQVFFLVFTQQGQTVEIEAESPKLPALSLSEIESNIAAIEEEVAGINAFFLSASANIESVRKIYNQVDARFNYREVELSADTHADNKIFVLEGYVPEDKESHLVELLENNSVPFLNEDVKTTDPEVPILLKNNNFSKLFEPIGKLFALPSYVELDMTPFFAPFFMLFFGLCMGDTGYGLLIFLAATFARKRVSPDLRPYVKLAQWLGGFTIPMGLVSGTFFGLSLGDFEIIPFRELFLQPLEMFYLAIGIGIVQILFGMGLRVVNLTMQKGIKYALSTVGWMAMLLSMIVFMGGSALGWWTSEQVDIPMKICLAGSFLLVILFVNPDINIFARMGLSIWDAYGVITGVFGDALSYIRLFALGMSGGILGGVFNIISSQLLNIPYVGWLLFIALALIGHTLNIFLSALGGFVHPMRLTFVEFYKNAGFIGGGREYKPFTSKQ